MLHHVLDTHAYIYIYRDSHPFPDRSEARHFVEKPEATFLDAPGRGDPILGMENRPATCHAMPGNAMRVNHFFKG